MKSNAARQAILGGMFLLAVVTLVACAGGMEAVKLHPVPVETSPQCSDCHPDERAALNHSPTWEHQYFAAQQSNSVCAACHNTSFCADCHANREELKPSDKYKESPTRDLPHRGDYLTQHKVDGRLNPAPCFRCHGRQNNDLCKRCHR